jgi:hypothetical protein
MSQHIFTHMHGLAHVLVLVGGFGWLAFLLCIETSLLPCCALRHAMLKAFSLFSSVPAGQTWGIVLHSVTLYPSLFFIHFSLIRYYTACNDHHNWVSWQPDSNVPKAVHRTACLQLTRCMQFVEGTKCIIILSSHKAWEVRVFFSLNNCRLNICMCFCPTPLFTTVASCREEQRSWIFSFYSSVRSLAIFLPGVRIFLSPHSQIPSIILPNIRQSIAKVGGAWRD